MKRKVYIATRKNEQQKQAAFGCLGKEFTIALTPEVAEFIILDCEHPAPLNEWSEAGKAHLQIQELCYPPIILAELGNPDPDLPRQLTWSFGADRKLPRCTTPQGLVDMLLTFQKALPFYNQANLPRKQQLAQELYATAAALSRTEESTK